MKKAFLFPGQGSQFIGMGKELASQFEVAKDVFSEVDEALGEKLSALMFRGDIKELTLTKNAQPAIMAVSLRETTPEAQSALYSPKECPAKRSIFLRFNPLDSMTLKMAMETAIMAG